MSCIGFLSAAHRQALAASAADGVPLSGFTSPPVGEGKLRRLRVLAGSVDPSIRASAAASRHTPPDVLERLALDPDLQVRRCVARNESAPARLLESLAVEGDRTVRGWVAANPASPRSVVGVLAGDPDPQVRAVAAWALRWPPPATGPEEG